MSTIWPVPTTHLVMTQTLPLALAHSGPSPSLTLEVGGDEALVRSIVDEGSEAAFRELYQRHTGRLYRIALRMTASEADAEDAVQETWLRTIQRIGMFEWRSALSTWLAGVVINVVREQLQRRGRWEMVELTDIIAADPIHGVDGDIELAIAALPTGARTVFVLHDIEGFTHEEIAQQLGWVAGTSKTQLFRARRALRLALGDDWKENGR
jgi:RNA polymerase sigma-70 factor (ECF subfamily)